MKKRSSQATRQARLAPLDHLRPGGRPETDADRGDGPAQAEGPREGADLRERADSAEPAEPVTPGAGDAEARRGKATRSPAAVATRRHLEGSEQGPQ